MRYDTFLRPRIMAICGTNDPLGPRLCPVIRAHDHHRIVALHVDHCELVVHLARQVLDPGLCPGRALHTPCEYSLVGSSTRFLISLCRRQPKPLFVVAIEQQIPRVQ
jgi:hypothetical protein